MIECLEERGGATSYTYILCVRGSLSQEIVFEQNQNDKKETTLEDLSQEKAEKTGSIKPRPQRQE